MDKKRCNFSFGTKEYHVSEKFLLYHDTRWCKPEHRDQAKRILRFIKVTYNAEPEFLWSSLPECAALRVPGKKPWFAVVGRIPKEKIGIEEGGLAEVINLKDEPKAVTARINEKKAYPAYHMNKQHWYTVLLDDSLDDEEIIKLVRTSFEIVNG